MANQQRYPPPLGDNFDYRREQGAESERYRTGAADNAVHAMTRARQLAFPLIGRPALVHFPPLAGPDPTLVGVGQFLRPAAGAAYTRRMLGGNKARIANNALRDRVQSGTQDGFVYRRVLGYGSQALTLLFELVGAVPADFAVKTNLGRDFAQELFDEKNTLLVLKRAAHIVQRTQTRELYARANPGLPVQPLPTRFQESKKIIFLEHLANGNLASWLDKAGSTGANFPTHELWLAFDCLVRACIAMRHPPRYKVLNRRRPADAWGPSLPETIPPNGAAVLNNHDNIVHFDIDPSNIFVGDLGANAHANMPILKVADFGLSEEPSSANFGINVNDLWRPKTYGKDGWRSPEQWTAEWDIYNADPTLDPLCEVAGQYDERSNIWQIGMTMWNLMTGHESRSPPVAKIQTVRAVHGRVLRHKYTHGWELDLPPMIARYPPLLRNTVKQCLMYFPHDRPSLSQLHQLCADESQKANVAIGAANAARRRRRARRGWATGFFVPSGPLPQRAAAPLGTVNEERVFMAPIP